MGSADIGATFGCKGGILVDLGVSFFVGGGSDPSLPPNRCAEQRVHVTVFVGGRNPRTPNGPWGPMRRPYMWGWVGVYWGKPGFVWKKNEVFGAFGTAGSSQAWAVARGEGAGGCYGAWPGNC